MRTEGSFLPRREVSGTGKMEGYRGMAGSVVGRGEPEAGMEDEARLERARRAAMDER